MCRRKLKCQREPLAGSPAVLEPGTRDQIPLFTVPRTLSKATVSAIVGRPVPGWERARAVLVEMAAGHGPSKGWRFQVAEMVRLALAVREAEGARLLPEAMLRDLPSSGDAVRQVLSQQQRARAWARRQGCRGPPSAPTSSSSSPPPDRGYVDVPAGTTALLATTGTPRIADDAGSRMAQAIGDQIREIKVCALAP